MSQLKKRAFALPPPFCSIQFLKGLNDAHLPWSGSSFLSVLIHTLSLLEHLTDTPRNIILPGTWESFSQVKLKQKLTISADEKVLFLDLVLISRMYNSE